MRMFRASLQALVLTAAWLVAAAAHGQTATTTSFSPNRAVAGQSVNFTWRGFAGSTRCAILGVPGLEGIQANGGTITFSASQNLNATVLCSRPGGGISPGASASARFTLLDSVPPPTITQASPDFEVQPFESVSIFFSTTGATTCNIRGTSSLDDIGTGGFLVIGRGPGLYESTITCFGPGGATTDTMIFTVFLADSPVISSLRVDEASKALLPRDFSLERDMDGDRITDRVEFSAARSALTIVFRSRDGSLEAKVLDKVADLSSVAIRVERTPEGRREVSLRSLR